MAQAPAPKESWQSISERKKTEQASRIPSNWLLPATFKPSGDETNVLDIPRRCGILSTKELEITERYDATELLALMRERKLTSREVVEAFCKRAAIAHQLTNCLTEPLFTSALDLATSRDTYLAKHGQPLGPLHGLPISLKDVFKIAGHDSSIGIAALAFHPTTTTSPLVQLLLDAGAVPICKTNVPQTMMALDSHNNVFGRVLNPLNLRLTAGGSSGGESALLAMRGSALGVGTDVGGSVRIPAMCGGLYGVKPSWQRLPFGRHEIGVPAGASKLGLQTSVGPIGRSLRDCGMFLRAVAEMGPWRYDADVVCGDWESQGDVRGGQVRMGLVKRDGVVEPLPPVQKLLDEVVGALSKRSVKVVELDITALLKQCQSLANQFFGIDGNNAWLDLLAKTGEPLSPWLSTRLRRKKPLGLEQLRTLHARRDELRNKFLSVWKQVDAFICPIAPHPIPPIDRWNGVSYTSSFVLLDFPAGTIPVRPFTHADLEGDIPSSPPLGPWDKVNRELWTKVDKSLYLDSPLSVQIVAPRMQERTLYEAMKIVDDVIDSEIRSAGKRSRL